MADKRIKLAVVIPVYGNEKSLPELVERIEKATDPLNVELTIQFVNDRSPDNSQKVIEELAEKDQRIRGTLLSRNHGSFVAIMAGLSELRDQDAVVIMSADLQDPPETIPEMLAKWREGFPVSLGVRRTREDSFSDALFSKVYHWLYRRFVMKDMPEGGFDFCLIDRRVADVLLESSEKNTSLVGLIIWAGFDRAFVEYDRAERQHGKSMWSLRKKLNYAINSIIAFSAAPLKFFAGLGFVLSLFSMAGIVYVIVARMQGWVQIPGWGSLALLILFMGSFQFLAFGILGEYFWNSLEQSRKRPLFIVDRRVGGRAAIEAEAPGSDVQFFDLASVSLGVRQALAESAGRALDSPRIILGPEVERFERQFAMTVGAKHCVGVANGTDAITLALWACGVQPGDIVITTAISAPPTAVAILRAGAKPLLVDVDKDTLLISPEAVERAFRSVSGVKAVVPVHLYGNPCEMGKINEIAAKYNAVVIEDCAQSFGSSIGGRSCGLFSNAAAFSFYPTKNLGAYGDAGAVTTDDPEVAKRLRMMRFYGQDSSGECILPGFNSRLDELQAALLLERMKLVDGHNKRRVEIASRYDAELGFLNPVKTVDGRVSHLYVVRPVDRTAFRTFLEANGVQTGVHYPLALTRHAYLGANSSAQPCPNAESACEKVVSLPCYPGMSHAQVEKVITVCKKWSEARL